MIAMPTLLALGALGIAVSEMIGPSDNVRNTLNKSLYAAKLYHEHKRQDGKKTIQKPKITAFYKEEWGYDITLRLPVGLTVSDVKSKLEVLEMSLDGEVKVESSGQHVNLKIGKVPLESRMNYHEGLCKQKGIHIPLHSHFGLQTIDIDTEIGAHILIGGASGMGKSKLLDLIMTLIVQKSNGSATIRLINNKMVDTFAYRDLPHVTIHESLSDAEVALDHALLELERRKKLMVAASVVKTSELTTEDLKPYFVVIDEYARFSDSKEFQSKVIEIAERGRSFDIHLVLATQRPDAKEVLNPRIKANCMTKIALKTTTASNSRVILETDDAYHLPEIQGRAILQKSGNQIVQVPYLSTEQQCLLLKPYYKKAGGKDDRTGSATSEVSGEVSRTKSGSNRKTGLQRYRQSISDSE